jgi:hypothetical protein
VVADYAERMRAGDQFLPLIVFSAFVVGSAFRHLPDVADDRGRVRFAPDFLEHPIALLVLAGPQAGVWADKDLGAVAIWLCAPSKVAHSRAAVAVIDLDTERL